MPPEFFAHRPGDAIARRLRRCLPLLAAIWFATTPVSRAVEWTALFNGRDLTGWDTYLRTPEGESGPPLGLNHDPRKVFSVADGAIRISGEVWGALISQAEFQNYHLRFQIKWGEKKWPPREHRLRDGGLLYHSIGPHTYRSECWMRSHEMQIQEGEIGDFIGVGAGPTEFLTSRTTLNGRELDQYDPYGAFKRTEGRVYRSGNFERPHGEWNTGELVARGADAVFIVNGFVVNRAFNTFRPDLQRQVTRGKLQFQSEAAEHFLRAIELRPLPAAPAARPRLRASRDHVGLARNATTQLTILNEGGPVEIIAAELVGKPVEHIRVTLPALPLTLQAGDRLPVTAAATPDAVPGRRIELRLETAHGPIEDLSVAFILE